MVKNPRNNHGDSSDLGQIRGQKDPLEKEIATHLSILAWKIPGTEEPDAATIHEVIESDTAEQLNTHTVFIHSFIHLLGHLIIIFYKVPFQSLSHFS